MTVNYYNKEIFPQFSLHKNVYVDESFTKLMNDTCTNIDDLSIIAKGYEKEDNENKTWTMVKTISNDKFYVFWHTHLGLSNIIKNDINYKYYYNSTDPFNIIKMFVEKEDFTNKITKSSDVPVLTKDISLDDFILKATFEVNDIIQAKISELDDIYKNEALMSKEDFKIALTANNNYVQGVITVLKLLHKIKNEI
jgi:hypothetical protein